MRPLLKRAPLLALLAAAFSPAEARAGGETKGLVLEVYSGTRPGQADAFMRPVLSELEARGHAAGPFAARKAIEALSRPPRSAQPASADDLRTAITDGYAQYVRGDFEAAATALRAALATIRDNPVLVAGDQTMLPLYQRALVGLSLAAKRAGRGAEAAETMSALVRTFPGAEISRAEYGPEPADFFKEVAARVSQAGRGRLIVEADEKSAVLFVNEHYAGVGRIEEPRPPGRYRVFARHGDAEGRVYEVVVEKDRDTRLRIDWNLDSAIHTGAKWTGLLLPEAATVDERGVDYAARLGRAIGVDRVVLVGIVSRPGETTLVGMVVRVDGARVIRQAGLSLDARDPPTMLLASLGRFLAGGDADPRLQIVVNEGAPIARPTPARPFRVWKWVALGTAVATAGAGATLVWLDGRCKGDPPARGAECRELHDTSIAAWTTIGGSVAVAGLAGFLFWRDRDRPESGAKWALVPGEGGMRLWATFDF